jgi:hypothetical protein
MAPRSVIDLLADQPEEALVAMRDAVGKELARLTVEAQQIDQALARKGRKNRVGGQRLTREQVFEVIERAAVPLTPPEVFERLSEQGLTASLNSVRNHLSRLVEQNGWLVRLQDGRFAISPEKLLERQPDQPTFVPAADEDVPF